MAKNLVIVESPAKARTLGRILGKSYSIKASVGHIRDLPRSQLGVDIENDFTPKYVVPRPKSKVVKELKEAVKAASTVYLATDPDREGEAISWHLADVTKANRTPLRRIVFHEITEDAVKNAFKQSRDIDMQLVDAQQARRVLDRLVGYKISPLLWKNVRRGLSAGRVQSVALKIIVDREREIEKFTPVEYWNINAKLNKKAPPANTTAFRSALVSLIDKTKLEIRNQKEVDTIKTELEQSDYSVIKAQTKKTNRQPAPPFITSTLQQEASRRFRFTARQTMAIAQQLYEGLAVGKEGSAGLITYMRTDSTRVARSAIDETRDFIKARHGSAYLPPHARSFSRAVKGAQDAHEAIRPTRVQREPAQVKQYLNSNQFRLYELIWKRMVASQMAAAIFDNTSIDIQASCPASRTDYLLRTSNSVNRFLGFMTLYSEQKDRGEEENPGSALPKLSKGDELNLKELFPEQHFTQPPHQFTEATLIKMLEQWGIGRPSTYAPTLSTIQDREYAIKDGGNFKPTELGTIVTDLLSKHFPNIVDINFTAGMENNLDEIAEKNKNWVGVIRNFYTPFEKTLDDATDQMGKVKLPDEVTDETCPEGHPMVIKTGRFGKFFACSKYPEHKFTKSFRIKTGAKCPQCNSDLVEKKNKKKRTFYGCDNYPKCDFAINLKPLPQPCPKCDGLLTIYSGKRAKCTKCEYRGKVTEPKTTAGTEQT